MAFTARTETYFNAASLTTPFDATVNKPSGTVEGDILFALINWFGSGVTIDYVPTGWNLLGSNSDGYYHYSLYYKIAGASEPSSYTWSFTGSAKVRIVCSCYTGGAFNASDPIDVVSNTAYLTYDANVRAASMTVASANSPLVFFASVYATVVKTFTKPSVPTTDWVEDDDAGSDVPDFWNEICSMIWTGSGATGNMDATCSTSSNTKHAFAVALKPSGGVTHEASASLSGTGTLACSASVTGTVTGAAALSGAGTLSASAKLVRASSASLSGEGTLAASALSLHEPVAITQEATNLQTTSARINGKMSDDGGEASDVRFRWRAIPIGTEINYLQDLDDIRNDLDGSFVLMKNLDFDSDASYDQEDPDWEGKKAAWTTGSGWQNIGTWANRFIGTFDGNGHSISNLFMDREQGDDHGLFGTIGVGGKVRCLEILNADVSGDYYVGALAGNLLGKIGFCRSTGTIAAVGSSSSAYAGGLVGLAHEGSAIEYCRSAASVSGIYQVGGLVGENDGYIGYSRASGAVTGGQYSEDIAGLCGLNHGLIECSYATGNVSGMAYLGGLVGDQSQGTISDSYSTGTVTRTELTSVRVAGFCGRNNDGKILNSYSTGSVHYEGYDDPTNKGFVGEIYAGGNYEDSGNFFDKTTSGQLTTAGNAVGKTTSEMQDIDTFEGWDIVLKANWTDETWAIDDGNDYPRLGWESLEIDSAGWIYSAWDTTGKNTDATFYYDLTGLDHSTEYEFQAQARNSLGEGAWSASEFFTTLAVIEGAAHLEGVGTLAASARMTYAAGAVLEGVGTLSASAQVGAVVEGAAVLEGIGSLSVSGKVTRTGAALLEGVGTIQVSAQLFRPGAAVLAGQGTLAAAAKITRSGSAALAGAGTLTCAGTVLGKVEGAASLQGTGTLVASGVLIYKGSAVLTGQGSLTAVGKVTRAGSASLSGQGSLSASAKLIRSGAASLTGEGALSGSAQLIKSGAASLQGAGTLAVAAALIKTASATLIGQGALAAVAVLILKGAAVLQGEGHITATGTILAIGYTFTVRAFVQAYMTITPETRPYCEIKAETRPYMEIDSFTEVHR